MAYESTNNLFFLLANENPEPNPTSPLFNSWNRCNTTILSWLANSLSPDLKANMMYINFAKDLWIDLKNRLSQDNTPRLFELQKEISHLVQDSLSFALVLVFVVLTSKSSQLDAQHKEHVFRFLMGLNDSYGNLIGQMLLIEHFSSFSKVCSLVLQEEKRRDIGNTVNLVQQLDAMAIGLPNFGVQSDSMFQNLVNTPFVVQFGFQNAIANAPFGVGQGASGNSFGGSFLQQSPQSFQAQCPISQAQCEQLLSFLKGYVGAGSGIGTQIGQAASVMVPNTISTPLQTSALVTLHSSLPFTSNSASCSSNFSDTGPTDHMKRLPFSISTHVSSAPFELIHCDIWGPFATCTVEGYKYFLVIVDDFSRCTWVYLLKLKSDTQVLLPSFANMVKTQFSSNIKTIRSDNVSLDTPNFAISIPDPTPLDDPDAKTSIPNPISDSDSAVMPTTQSIQPQLRRSTRPHNPPSYLSDYFCQSFVLVVSATPSEPVSFHQAIQYPE
nr:uncharacterized protein LOC112001870 [Quercus suber]